MSIGQGQHPLVSASLRLLSNNREQLPIPTPVRDLAVSQRQLERLYQSQVGISPKQYARLLRVEKARLALKQFSETNMTALGLDLGYYDQPHFIREFRAVIGMTPYAYLKRQHG